jgi:hypothetical protein
MTLRRQDENHNLVIRLSGWKLVVALLVMAIVIISALWMTGSVKAAILVTFPLLVGLGAISIRRL